MGESNMVVSDGRVLVKPRDPPGQLSVYIIPSDTKRETYRLMTFQKYPEGSAVDPWTLAKAGFFYRGYKDRVQCHSCGSQVQDWETSDNPRDAKWHEITCKFDRYNPEENDAISAIRDPSVSCGPQTHVERSSPPAMRALWKSPEVTVSTVRRRPAGQVLGGASAREAVPGGPNMNSLAVMYPCNNAYSPHLTSLQSRIQTFADRQRSWAQVRIHATAQQMAEAGLYYLGDGDRVKCYYCNGGLQNWSYYDNPWFEHAKWFPLCEYVLRNKGPEYVEQVTQRFAHLSRPHGAGSRPPVGIASQNLPLNPNYGSLFNTWRPQECIDRPPQIVDPGEERVKKQQQIEKEIASSEVIQAAFEMGFEMDLIKRALSIRLDEYGRGYGKVETLVRDLMEIQSQEEIEAKKDLGETAEPQDEITKVKEILKQDKCRICQYEPARTLLLPCGHLVVCKLCGPTTSRCPICQVKVTSTINTFRV